MTIKGRVIVTVVWTALVLGAGVYALYYAHEHPIPGADENARAEKLGEAVGTVAVVGWAVIWLPLAFRRGWERRASQAKRRGKRR